jgi:hypothetical protein
MNARGKHLHELLAAALLVSPLVQAHVDAAANIERPGRAAPSQRRWTLHGDNDLFALTHKDRDYTAGVSVTLTDTKPPRADAETPFCAWEARCGRFHLRTPTAARALEIGLELYTPEDLASETPLRDDRPYASLLYAARSKLAHDPLRNVAYQSTLTVGLLGLRLAERVHRRVHAAVGATLPMGYAHQISDGGEPTFRYALSRYRLLGSGRLGAEQYDLRFDTTVSVGFLTEANASLAFRWGNLADPWWASFVDEGDYAGQPVIGQQGPASPRGRSFALTAGMKLRGRLYDAFLQGQFRHSDVTYSSSAIEHVLSEVWLGLDVSFNERLHFRYVVRRQSKELRRGTGSRAFTWAGLSISRRFD